MHLGWAETVEVKSSHVPMISHPARDLDRRSTAASVGDDP
jgi:hypothetical protein